MYKKIAIFITALVLVFGTSYASERPNLDVQTKVRVSGEKSWEDKVVNVTDSDYIEFRIRISNDSEQNLSNVKMTNFLPSELERYGGTGLTEYFDIGAGDKTTFVLQARMKDGENAGNKCIYNDAEVEYNDREYDTDEVAICYTDSAVLGASIAELPKTGPENSLLILMGGISLVVLGMKTKKNLLAQ